MIGQDKNKEKFQPLWGAEKKQPLEKRVSIIQRRVWIFSMITFLILSELLIWVAGFDPRQFFALMVFAAIVCGNIASSQWKYPTT